MERDSEHFIPARLRMAYIYYQQQDKDQARRILEEIRKALAPDREEIYLTISYFYEEENRWDRAIAALKRRTGKGSPAGGNPLPPGGPLRKNQKIGKKASAKSKKCWNWTRKIPDAQNFLGYTYAECRHPPG